MTRLLPASLPLAVGVLLVPIGLLLPRLHAEPARPAPAPEAERTPGQFFTVTEPITDEVVESIKAQTLPFIERATRTGESGRPILVFEILPGETRPGQSAFGSSYELATFLSTRLHGARLTVAYVPEPLSGYAALAALACDEIVMGRDASLGPIVPEERDAEVTNTIRESLRELARNKGRDPDLLLGMLEPGADLRRVRTADRATHYVLAQNLARFAKEHPIVEDEPAWPGGRRGVLTAEEARARGISKLTAENRAQIASTYHLAGESIGVDPTLGDVVRPVWIKIDGYLDPAKEVYLKNRIERARQDKVNLILFEVDCDGGIDSSAENVADVIAHIKDMKTVAYINDRAMNAACLVPLACGRIVFHKGGQIGGLRESAGGGDRPEGNGRLVESLAKAAVQLARDNGHPEAIARALIDPQAVVLQARDNKTGGVVLILESQEADEPGRYTVLERRKEAGETLTLTDDLALSLGVTSHVVATEEDFKALFNLRNKPIRVEGPTWVDALVTTLNTTWMSTLLLFLGMFMLILELKMPGISLPGILSALSFMLFFWSRYLGGTADQLEIILFVVGLICLALELFVFPGFGVFGMSGILLILISVVMASHTFVWPTEDYEYRQMGRTLLQITLVMVSVGAGAVLIARYLPSLPLFNRIVLKPEPAGEGVDLATGKPAATGEAPLSFLVGETGRTTTVLRPTGKARFGELLVDVTADGFYIEPDSLVEVVEVQGSRVIVKRV